MNDNIIETIEYKNHTIEIGQDMFEQESPLDWSTPDERKCWYVMSHKRYHVPNELEIDFDEFDSWQAVADFVYKEYKYVCKFVRWYEHSGIAVSLRDDTSVNDWDAGIVGCIFGETTQDIENSFVDWQAYIQGDIYAWSTDDDSCAGYYGESGYKQAIAEAKQAIDLQVKREASEKRKATIAKQDIATAQKLAKKHGYILAEVVK